MASNTVFWYGRVSWRRVHIPPFPPVNARRVTGLVWDLIFLSLDE